MNPDLNNLTITELKRLQARGIIDVKIKPGYEGKDITNVEITDLKEFKPYKHLLGHGISISEASRRYDITRQTLSKWVRSGHLKVIGMDKNRKLIDEGTVAYYASKYQEIAKEGRRTDRLLFD